MTGVRVEAVAKSFAGRKVLHGIDLVVPDKAVLALLGQSGCGKTTLLRLIAGLERVDAGAIAIGAEIVDQPSYVVPPERRRVGYVPQEGLLFPHLTVAGNVAYGLSRRERKGPRVREILGLVGLADFADHHPHQLSGGQQQRAALARALAPAPALVLLDEPFNALDLDLRRSMCEDVIVLLRQAGATVMLVTHDPTESFATADLVAVIHGGTIMQCASPAEVYRTPTCPTVARLTGPTIFLNGRLRDDRIETALGSLPLLGRVDDTIKVCAMLRPEQIVVTNRAEGRKATVVNHRFRGDHTALTVIGDGFRLDVRAPTYGGERTVHLRVRGSCVAFASKE